MFNQVTPQGDTVRRTVDVIQKLVVKKWRNTEEYEAFCYIASIVPTPEYYAKHKNVGREFRYGGDKGEFSGFVIYRTLAGKLVGIDNYERGRRTRHDYFPRITGENEDSIYSVARLSVPEMEVQAGTASAFSMNMEEDDPCKTYVTDPVFCVTERPKHYCPSCGYEYCICGKDNWPDHPNPGGGTVTVPDYNDGGNQGYPGGGGGGGGVTVTTVRPIQEKDCGGQAGENAANAQMIYNAFNDAGLQDFINERINDNIEWSVSLNYDTRNGKYVKAHMNSGNSGHVRPGYSGGDVYTAAILHTHPSGEMPHSIADVASLINIYQLTGNKTKTSFVAIRKEGAPPIIYAIQIENATLANAFYNNYDESLKNQIHNESQEIFDDIYKVDNSLDESYAYSMSFLLDKYNTGIKILKCENGNNFKQKNTTISGNTITRTTCK